MRRRGIVKYLNEANVFIGGEGVNTSSASELETLLGLTPGAVTYFNLDGNNIEAYINENYEIPSFKFESNLDITYYEDLENLTKVNQRGFLNAENLVYFKSTNCLSIGSNALSSVSALIEIDCPSCIVLEGSCLFASTNLATINLPSLVTAAVNSIRRTAVVNLSLPSLTSAGSSCFRENSNIETLNIPLCATLGVSVGDDNVFNTIKTGCTITCPVSLETANGGNREGDIAYAEDIRSAIIIYV